MLKKFLTGLSVAALVLPAAAQEAAAPAAAPATISQSTEEPDNIKGFTPQAMQEWQVIEKELQGLSNDPEAILNVLNANLQKNLLEETRQLICAVKVAVLNKMLEDIYRTAKTEEDILKAKSLATELVMMMPDEKEKQAALAEIETRFADPAALLRQVFEARAEQEAAAQARAARENISLTKEDFARIGEIRKELEAITDNDAKLEYLHSLVPKENDGIKNWLQLQLEQIILDEITAIRNAGINTVEDVLKCKTTYAKVIRYCYPEKEKARAMELLEEEYADPEALLRQYKSTRPAPAPAHEPAEEEEEDDVEEVAPVMQA